MEDREILALFEQRSTRAISAAEAQYGRILRQLCRNLLDDRRDVEECLSDTFFALWNAIPPERPEPLAAYACKVARQLALKKRRDAHAQKRDSRKNLPLDELSQALSAPSAEENWEADQLGRTIDAFLDRQKQIDRVLFVRRYWFGDEVKAAAGLVGLSENAASIRLRRLRLRLREYLIQEGYAL